MKLLFRHIKKSILNAPRESIIILLTVFVSALLFITAGEIYCSVSEDEVLKYNAANGNADILVSPITEMGSRFVTVDAISAARDDFRDVCGILSLPFSTEGCSGTAAAIDIKNSSKIFEFAFVETLPVSENDLPMAVYISKSFADKNDISLGECIKLNFLGSENEFKVAGINRNIFFDSYDVLIEIDGALRILNGVSPIFSVFDEDNLPYTKIFGNLKDGVSPNITVEKINGSNDAADAFASVLSYETNDYIRRVKQVVFATVIACTLVISCTLVIYSLRILAEKRKKDTEAFLLVGMKPSALFFAFSLELFVYLIIGTVFAVISAVIILPIIFDRLLTYASLGLSFTSVLTVIIGELLVGGISLIIYRATLNRKKTKKRTPNWIFGVFVIAALIFVSLLIITPVRFRYIFAAFTLVFLLFALVFGMGPFLQLFSKFLSENTNNPSLILALKNNTRINEMRYLHCVLASIISIAVLPVAALMFFDNLVVHSESRITAEYVITGTDVDIEEKIISLDGTYGVTSACVLMPEFDDDELLFLIGADDFSFFDDFGNVEGIEPPTGNEILLPKTMSDLFGISLGENISVNLGKKSYDFVLSGYTSKNSPVAFINASDMGFSKNIMFVKGSDTSEYLDRLTESASLYGGFAAKTESVFRSYTNAFRIISKLLSVYIAFIFILSLIGCANLIYVGYSRRKAQFDVLTLSGMSKKEQRSMIFSEICLLAAVVIVIGGILGAVFIFLLDMLFCSFGFSLFF